MKHFLLLFSLCIIANISIAHAYPNGISSKVLANSGEVAEVEDVMAPVQAKPHQFLFLAKVAHLPQIQVVL